MTETEQFQTISLSELKSMREVAAKVIDSWNPPYMEPTPEELAFGTAFFNYFGEVQEDIGDVVSVPEKLVNSFRLIMSADQSNPIADQSSNSV